MNIHENDTLNATILVMDALAKNGVLTEQQSADEDFAIQDAIQEAIEVVFQRIKQRPTTKENV